MSARIRYFLAASAAISLCSFALQTPSRTLSAPVGRPPSKPTLAPSVPQAMPPAPQAVAPSAAEPAEPAKQIAPYDGTLAQGLEAMQRASEAKKPDEALAIADALLAPKAFLRWRDRAQSEEGFEKNLLEAAAPVFAWLGLESMPATQRAAVHYARGVVLAQAKKREASEKAFDTARALAGSGDLRLDSIYNLGVSALEQGEEWRAQIPELNGGQNAQASPAPNASQPATPGAPPPPDPLAQARQAYLHAREHFVERLRADWQDGDTRAEAELVERRLKELDRVQKKREEQKKQEQQKKDDSKKEQQDKDQQNKDKQQQDQKDKQDSKDQDKQQKPEDKKPEDQPKQDEPKKDPKDDKQPEDAQKQDKNKDKQDAQPTEPKEELLTKEEVMRLLDILKQREEQGKRLQEQLHHARRTKVKKDW